MSDNTKIEWTDATANVINGCTVVSPGCANCYAMKQAHRFPVRQGLTRQSPSGMTWTGEVRFSEEALQKVLGWKRPRRIFWNAHGDIFHPAVPDEWIDRCFTVMALTPQHTHQVLTKRPERMRDYLTGPAFGRVGPMLNELKPSSLWNGNVYQGWQELGRGMLPNVWLGTSVEDQQRADERIPFLLDTPAAVRWISAEPLLGPVDLTKWAQPVHHHPDNSNRDSPAMLAIIKAARDQMGGGIDWVVVGGESGPGARPMHPDWARSLRDQCAAAGVPFLFKQWGDFHPADQLQTREQSEAHGSMGDALRAKRAHALGDQWTWRIGKKLAGRLLDGVQHDGYPA